MAEIKQDQQTSLETTTPAKSYIGTAIGVGFVGVVILASYITLYTLYMARF